MRQALVTVATLALWVATGVASAGMNGTWSGRFVIPQEAGNIPTSAYPVAKLVVGPASVRYRVSGKTQAAHDPDSARSTCVLTLRFSSALSSNGWRVYQQVTQPVLSGSVSGGPPELAPCGAGASHLLLRIRPAATKLRAEFGERYGNTPEFGSGGFRAYLTH